MKFYIGIRSISERFFTALKRAVFKSSQIGKMALDTSLLKKAVKNDAVNFL